jgi:5'-deoxynucleotidase YfbR-like HD superfamily hydrolase/tRNA A-37 threonylcarbamoyl transferase component Bud32
MSDAWRGALLARRYRLEDELGSGAMARVFRAQDTLTETSVAVKILRPEHVEESSQRDAFLREARLGATVIHPNVVAVNDVGVESDGTHYLVMELLEGESLGRRIEREGPVGLATIYDIGAQMALGLIAAHAKGVIHRDLKPDNVLLVPKIGGGVLCKIVDFGIAKLLGRHGGSRPGAFAGTPTYVSPEQAMSEAIDVRTDIYSLGITLYEMAAGEPPFIGDSAGDVLGQHLHEPPPAIGPRREANGCDEALPTLLEGLIGKCLEKEPDDRPVSARRLKNDLEALRRGVLDSFSAKALHESRPRMPRVSDREAFEPLRARLREALSLKEVARAGWVRAGIPEPESVAAHSWGVAWLVLALCPAKLDRGRALAIAVIHDLAEVRTGDITPHDGVDADDKRQRERSALEAIVSPMPDRDELVALWRQYEDGSTPEGRFVKACDKLDMALQAERYQRTTGVDTSEFIASALRSLDDDALIALIRPREHKQA